MRRSWVVLLLGVVGCHGPLALPAVERLEVEDQQVVDESWHNMLSPPERLDRLVLLDVLVANSLYQQGVDRLHFVSEKDVWGGRVIMTIYYDRAHPAFDHFSIAFVDARGRERRRERFTFEEVKNRATSLMAPMDDPATQSAVTPGEVERQRQAERERAERLARQILIQLATRPAGAEIDESEIVTP